MELTSERRLGNTEKVIRGGNTEKVIRGNTGRKNEIGRGREEEET